MGAKTGLIVYADGDVPGRLRHVGAADVERTSAMMRGLHPGCEIQESEGSALDAGVYPPDGTTYAASWPGVEIVCDRRVMISSPSRLPAHLVAASAGRRLVLHAMHSVIDWLAFAVWEDGRLIRSLSLAPDDGIIENIGEPLPFERPYWAGNRPADTIAWPGEEEEPYALPFHPLELGEEALRALCGFIQEGMPEPGDVDAENIALHGFVVRGPNGADPAGKEGHEESSGSHGPLHFCTRGSDGVLIERNRPW